MSSAAVETGVIRTKIPSRLDRLPWAKVPLADHGEILRKHLAPVPHSGSLQILFDAFYN